MNTTKFLTGTKILFVDDDKETRSEFKDCFDQYEIVEASSGADALEIIKKPNEIVLAILDVRMPGMNGLELLREIRKVAPDIAIIILTGYGSKDVVVESLRGAADDYIEKPFNIEKTKALIEKLIRKRRGEENPLNDDTGGKIERIKLFIERNWQKKLSLNDAANTVCLSPKYLSRVFKENTGLEFSDYKIKVKINKAKELLSETGYNISETAYKLGYENIESFIKIFKKTTGLTPSEFKNNSVRKKTLIEKSQKKTDTANSFAISK